MAYSVWRYSTSRTSYCKDMARVKKLIARLCKSEHGDDFTSLQKDFKRSGTSRHITFSSDTLGEFFEVIRIN